MLTLVILWLVHEPIVLTLFNIMASPWKQNFSFFASELTAQTIAHQYGQLPWRTEVDARTEMRLKAIKAHQGARCVPKKREQQLQVIIFEKLLTKRQTDEPDWRMVKVHFDELSTTVVCGFRHTWKFCNANQISRKIWTRWLGKKTYRARDFCWNFNHEDLSFVLKIHQNHYTAPLLRHHIHSIQSIFVTL